MDLWADSPMWAYELLVALEVMGGDRVGFLISDLWALYLTLFLPW